MKNIYENFEAELQLDNGEFLADGTASIDLENGSVTFTSEFVPLYELETKANIFRVYKGKIIHKFNGQVYLSDRNLMRIVSVSDELFEGSEDCYSSNIRCKATIIPTKTSDEVKVGDKKVNIDKLNGVEFDIEIIDLTDEKVIFDIQKSRITGSFFKKLMQKNKTEMQKLEENQQFIVKNTDLPIGFLNFRISKILNFGENPRMECDIVNLTTPERIKLKEFLWMYNLQNNKLF
ncbi:MAG: hypothetical protein R3Y12_00915 [Clostridia bacterium]